MNDLTLTECKRQIINTVYQLMESSGVDMDIPVIKFSNRMSTTAGKAVYNRDGSTELVFSIPIFMNNDFEHYMGRTVPHEVAHILAYGIYGELCGHDRRWKAVMTKYCGIQRQSITRCHTYKVERRTTKSYKIKCPCCETVMTLTSNRVGRMRRGTRYRHNCGGTLDYSLVC